MSAILGFLIGSLTVIGIVFLHERAEQRAATRRKIADRLAQIAKHP